MNTIDELMSQLPIDQLAQSLGVDAQTAQQAAATAIPALVQGMQANATDEAGANSLAEALAEHAEREVPDVESVDPADGEQIVGHVFGANQDQVLNQLGGATGAGKDLVGKLLPMLAPIVMAFLARKLGRGQGPGAAAGQAGGSVLDDLTGAGGSGGGLGGVLGDILGGGQQGSGGGGLADVLGQVLGGSSSSQGGGVDLGDLLGGLLGGGRR